MTAEDSYLTPAEFAALHGLSLEEAELILSRRRVTEAPAATNRLDAARATLLAAQKRVGVHPVVAGEGIETVYDPDADVGVQRFFEKAKPRTPVNRPVVSVEDESQDPGDY